VKSGSLVAVFVERGVEMIVALLGTMKAGEPMYRSIPRSRRIACGSFLGDAKASIVLTRTRSPGLVVRRRGVFAWTRLAADSKESATLRKKSRC